MPMTCDRRGNPAVVVLAIVLLVLCFVALAVWAKRSDWQVRRLPLHGQEQTLDHRQAGVAGQLSRI
jgi:cytochrome oxidase assembly protein ShyY1